MAAIVNRTPPTIETLPPRVVKVHNYSIAQCQVECKISESAANLKLDLQFPADEIQPLFSGGCWAGTVVWEASILLSNYLIQNREILFPKFENRSRINPRVIELGSGVGVPGFVASLLGADVVVTEQEPLDELLARNAHGNSEVFASWESHLPLTACLDWNDASTGRDKLLGPKCLVGAQSRKRAKDAKWLLETPDIILISDCIYEQLYGTSWMLLAKVLDVLMGPTTVVLNSLERRNVDGIDSFIEYAKREFGIDTTVLHQGKGPNGEDLELLYHHRPL